MKRFTKEKSVDLFKRKCAKENKCTNDCSKPDDNGVIICDICCQEDLCNEGEGPKEASQKSGTSRIQMMRGLSLVGLLLRWFL